MRTVDMAEAQVRPSSVAAARMHAIVHAAYGTPDVLRYDQIACPTPRPGEVLVRVHAANVSIGDHHIIAGKPYLVRLSRYGGVPRPKNPVPGTALSGRVAAVGSEVTGLRVGDAVYGEASAGAFAEYIVLPASHLAPKPRDVSFEEAAALPWAVAALQGLRDAGRVVAGESVLINGASGGVGTWAIQIGKALGAEVTAVCSTRHLGLMRRLGADHVVDYTQQDFTRMTARFDVLFDLVGNQSLAACLRVLKPKGSYVASSGRGGDWLGPLPRIAAMALRGLFTRRRLIALMSTPTRNELLALNELVESGKAKAVIERCYALHEASEALRHVGGGHAQGQSILRITG
jgi:NADPH:quinone reductase-like Zn-dependent oxidoreductase